MEHHHIFFALYVRGLTAVLLFGGFGVEGEENGSEEVPILLHAICFCAVGSKGRSAKQNEEPLMSCNCNFEIIYLFRRNCFYYIQRNVTELFP